MIFLEFVNFGTFKIFKLLYLLNFETLFWNWNFFKIWNLSNVMLGHIFVIFKVKKARKVGKPKDGRRKKGKKAAMKKSKRARISKTIRPYKLDAFYRNPRSRASADSSLESMDYFQPEETYDCWGTQFS